MIHIPSLRTARFNVEIKELCLIDSIKLLNMPEHLEHKQTTFAINAMIDSFSRVKNKESLEDVKKWTFQERTFAIANYIAGTQEDNPDFAIGDLVFTDYLQADKQFSKDFVELGDYEGDNWKGYPLLGCMLEAIENLHGEIEGIESTKLHWIIGCMACQLVPNDQFIDFDDPDHEKEVLTRMQTIANFPESDFGTLYVMLQTTNNELMHLFDMEITENGIVAVSKEVKKEVKKGNESEVTVLQQYARFPSNSIVGRLARSLSSGSIEPDS